MAHLTRVTMRFSGGYAESDGRYWARTSDPQLVEERARRDRSRQEPTDGPMMRVPWSGQRHETTATDRKT
jgi:hypothetical protein